MRKLFIFLLSCVILFVHTGLGLSAQNESSTFIFRNPPSSSWCWEFDGNQVIKVTYHNLNNWSGILVVDCDTLIDSHETIVLPPFLTSQEHIYSIFGYTPIFWRFSCSTFQDVTLMSATARWDSFVPDRPGYRD